MRFWFSTCAPTKGTFDPLKRRGVRKYVIFRSPVDPIKLENYDGLIVLGGPMSVNQLEFPHLKEEIY